MAITVVFMVVLLGFAALVIDVGSWYRAHRSAQATRCAALAGAQVLPDTGVRVEPRHAVREPRTAAAEAGPERHAADHVHQQGYESWTRTP
jgi:hypothetical protein